MTSKIRGRRESRSKARPHFPAGMTRSAERHLSDNVARALRRGEPVTPTMAITPLDYMLATLNDARAPRTSRQWAAQTAAPYVHRKMPLALEGGDPQRPVRIAAAEQLRTLTPEEFAAIKKVSATLIAATPSPADIMSGIARHLLAVEASKDDNDAP